MSSNTEKATEPGRTDRMLPLRRADLAVVGLQIVELTGLERAHLPRQRVGRRALEHES